MMNTNKLRNHLWYFWVESLFDRKRSSAAGWFWKFFIFHIVQPFGVLEPFVDFGLKKHIQKGRQPYLKWGSRILLMLILIITCAGAFPISQTWLSAHSTWKTVWLSFSLTTTFGIFLNLISFPFLWTIWILGRIFLRLADSVEGLLGHKVWSRPTTTEMLQAFMDNNQGCRAKWFPVTFLSHLVEDRVYKHNNPPQFYRLATPKDGWHICRYSRFLADNMNHAERQIAWLVDPTDFFEILLPELCKYVLAGAAVAKLNAIPIVSFTGGFTAIDDVWRAPLDAASTLLNMPKNEISKIIGLTEAKTRHGSTNVNLQMSLDEQRYDNLWRDFELLVLAPLWRLGALVCSKCGAVTGKELNNGFIEFSNAYLDVIFPHFVAFSEAHVPTRKRVIWLWKDGDRGETTTFLNTSIKAFWVKFEAKCQEIEKDLGEFANPMGIRNLLATRNVVSAALDLFEHESGSGEFIEVREVKNPEVTGFAELHLDIGIYDGEFVVWSFPCEAEYDYREVQWYYMRQQDESGEVQTEEDPLSLASAWLTPLHEALCRELSEIPNPEERGHKLAKSVRTGESWKALVYGCGVLLGNDQITRKYEYTDFRETLLSQCT